MEELVFWKKRRDKYQDSDNVSGMGDQIEEFSERESPSLVGNPKGVKFIAKDSTNAKAMRKLGVKW